jgi:succinoglycan biosynthesis transport protein ExoP
VNNSTFEWDGGGNGQSGGAGYAGPAGYGPLEGDGLFQIIWHGRWLILLSLVAALAAAWFYLQRATPMYESTARILVDKPGLPPRTEVPQPVGSTSSNYLQTQASLITSREIVTAALRDPNVLTLPTLRSIDFSVEQVLQTLTATVAKNTDIVSITAKSPYPEDAAQIVNAVVRAYIRWHDANRQLSTADVLKDLNGQLEKRHQDLLAKRKERMMFEQRYPEVVESVRGGLVSKTLDVLKQDLAAARLNMIQQDSFYDGLKRFENEPEAFRQYVNSHRAAGSASVEDAERTRLKQELFAAELELEQLSRSGSVQQATQVQSRRAQLQREVAGLDQDFVARQTALAKALAEDAHAREKQLTDLYEKEFAKVQDVGGRDAEYAFITSECDMLQSLCDSLLTQINALDLNANFQNLNIHVLEKAVAALKPSSPQMARILAVAVALGLLAGAGLALLRDWRDPRVRSADEILALVGARVLAAVPSMPKWGMAARGQRLRFAASSREAEVYRALRTALLFGAPREQAMTVLVTSPARLEGKTTLVSNLGIAMAQAGQKTLILDADLRKPMQHRIFALNGHKRGLTDVLTGAAPLEETIRRTEVPGLDVLTGGQHVANPSELLNSPAFARTFEHLKVAYDRILVDSSPVGEVTDAQILASYCGLTLLVLRAERSTRLVTQQARDALLTVGARLIGVVVNDVARRDKKYSHSSLYAYPYGEYGIHEGRPAVRELPVAAVRPPEDDDEPGEQGT